MPLPSKRTDVPRGQVGNAVDAMLTNPAVKDVDCTIQSNGNYTVTPHG